MPRDGELIVIRMVTRRTGHCGFCGGQVVWAEEHETGRKRPFNGIAFPVKTERIDGVWIDHIEAAALHQRTCPSWGRPSRS